MKPILYAVAVLLLLESCYRPKHYPPPRVIGYRALYSDNIADLKVAFTKPTKMVSAGNIYVKDKYIYQLDQYKGIHVYDNTIPAQIKNIGFIQLKGVTEISIKGNILLTNAYADLISVDISDVTHPRVVGRVPYAFAAGYIYDADHLPVNPPNHGVYYECPNPYKGILTGWVKDSIDSYCYYP